VGMRKRKMYSVENVLNPFAHDASVRLIPVWRVKIRGRFSNISRERMDLKSLFKQILSKDAPIAKRQRFEHRRVFISIVRNVGRDGTIGGNIEVMRIKRSNNVCRKVSTKNGII
jgi:hypothetical protein